MSTTRRLETERERMVALIRQRGVREEYILDAFRAVPRHAFVGPDLEEFAYEDAPLPIGSGQTVSQPYMVALMVQHAGIRSGEKVLEVGTGSGYAAAVYAEIARDVHTIERYADLADSARTLLDRLGYDNVHVRHGDGTTGWRDEAPFDAIVVAAGGPAVPESLERQLQIGGRLVVPVGESPRDQVLVRVTRLGEEEWRREELGAVRFVPLVGEEGWREEASTRPEARDRTPTLKEGGNPGRTPTTVRFERVDGRPTGAARTVAEAAEPFPSIEEADLSGLLDRIGDAKVVCLGEASHGTSEFYRMRAKITQALIEEKGFDLVAVEADWPDAARIDHYVRTRPQKSPTWAAFSRFPTWMWRNQEVLGFVERLRTENADREPDTRVGFFGLDLYSLYTSIGAVVAYLQETDPEAAEVARRRYGCLTPWEADPATYGHAATTERYRACTDDVVAQLEDLLAKRLAYMEHDGGRFFDAEQNARVVKNAESYYRSMYEGRTSSWNLRDRHMFDTLERLLEHHGPDARAVVWAHNSHLGDARHTEMGARDELNVGQLCRERWGDKSYLVGFGTHTGTVAAASHWDAPMQTKEVRPSHARSYERVCHDSGIPAFFLPLRHDGAREALMPPRLERAIGVIYRPETELASHYFQAVLPRQFDEWCWFDKTEAVRPLVTKETAGMPETYPFGV